MAYDITIVGQAPSSRADGGEPLSGASGRRLADLLGIDLDELRGRAKLVNLIDQFPGKRGKGDAFPVVDAITRARKITRETTGVVILLGYEVALAFEITRFMPYFEAIRCVPTGRSNATDAVYYIFPHPSGVNRFWNEAKSVRKARAFLRRIFREARRTS